MPQRKLGGTGLTHPKPGIMRETHARPEREPKPGLQVKEGDCAMLEFRSNDPFRLQTKAITIKRDCPFQVVNAERNYRDTWLHG